MKTFILLLLIAPALGGCAAYDQFSRSGAVVGNYKNTTTVCSGPTRDLMHCTEVSRQNVDDFLRSFADR